MKALQACPPKEIGGAKVNDVTAYPGGRPAAASTSPAAIRVQVRPSGTEPKVKFYGEAVGADPKPYLDALTTLLVAATASHPPPRG